MGTPTSQQLRKRRSKSEVSRILRLKNKELKQFEKEGLFDYADESRRWIDHENFERLRVAIELKRDLGVNLPGIDVILAMRDKMQSMKNEMNIFLSEVRGHLGEQVLEDISEIAKKTRRN